MPLIYDPTGEPIEIAEGRGDLRFSSVPFEFWPGGGGNVVTVDGRVVSHADLYAKQTWIAAAVKRLLSWSVRVPLKAYRQTGDDSRERLREHPLADAVKHPWERGSQAQLVTSFLGSELIHGNGLLRALSGARGRIEFEPIDWRVAKPIKGLAGRIAGWKVTQDSQVEEVPADQVLHLAWWSPLGPLGISPLQQLGTTISIEDAAQGYQRAYLKNFARPPSQVQMPDGVVLDKETRDEIRADLAAVAGDHTGRPALMPGGLEWKSIGHTAHEAELIDQRKVAREEVAAVYQIPPPMLGILDKATYSNIQTQREMAYTDALGPPLVLIEQTINAQLVRGLLRETDIYVEFDFAGVLRGDRLKEVQAIREAIGTGVLTPNEGRTALNYPKSDDERADQLYMPTNNLEEIGDAGSSTQPERDDPEEDS